MLRLESTLLVLAVACSTWPVVVRAQYDDEKESSGANEIAPELPSKNPIIYSLHITSNVTYRFANTLVTSQLANTAQDAKEIEFEMVLPKAAFINTFHMEIDGEIYTGKVKGRTVAKKQYDKAKKKGESAGKISAQKTARDSTLFKVTVNVAAESKVNFNLTYQELLQRRLGAYEHVINIDPGQVVRDLQVHVYVLESRDLTFLKVPPLREGSLNVIGSGDTNELAEIDWDGGSNAVISYSPTVDEQLAASQDGVSGQFVVQYDVQRDLDAGEIQVIDGYFVHFFAPSGLQPVPKNVLFVLDVSGSMTGAKLEQTKSAMMTILNDLEEEDMFSIVLFSDSNIFWRDERNLVPATLANIKQARRFVRKMRIIGGTNINDAVVEAVEVLKSLEGIQSDITRPSIVIFLTDGQGSTGETTVLHNVRQANGQDSVTLFSLGFGGGVNFDFLQRMSLQNGGLARKIYPDADAELQLRGFYQEVSTPLLSQVQIDYLGDAVDDDSLTGSDFRTFFQGSELVVAGRLKDNDVSNILTQVSAESSTGDISLGVDVDVLETEKSLRGSAMANFTERLWAYLTIRKLLDKMAESEDSVTKEAAKQEATALSLKYSFVTPLTSMVVTKPEVEKPVKNLSEQEDLDKQTGKPLRSPKGPSRRIPHSRHGVDNDPHFIVKMGGLAESICFDVNGKAGDVFQLVYDARQGIVVNGQVVQNDVTDENPDEGHAKSYFGQIAIMREGKTVKITPSKILVDGEVHLWRENVTVVANDTSMKLRILRKKSVLIDLGNGVVFMVLRHMRKVGRPGKVNFLGFYIRDGKGLSHNTHGLIGQFQHRSVSVLQHDDGPKFENGQPLTRLKVKGAVWAGQRTVEARLIQRRHMEIHGHVPCWFVRNSGHGLLDARHADYTVPKLTTTRFALWKHVRMGRNFSRYLL